MTIRRGDQLGKLVKLGLHVYRTSPDWSTFVRRFRGRSCVGPLVSTLPHPAADLLEKLRVDGAPVHFTTPDWSQPDLYQAAHRGSHKSAQEYLHFVEEEMSEFVSKDFWTVLPLDEVKDLSGLRLSPLGCVPQRDRRPRLIVDYTFSGVNQETAKLAPHESMQFGRALDRILLAILRADPAFGPVYLMKIDLSDGFYRVNVHPDDVAKLGVIMPTAPGEPELVAFLFGLPMGWTESPPWFSAVTETIIDLANDYCGTSWDPPRHPMEALAATAPPFLSPTSPMHILGPPRPTPIEHHVPTLPPRPQTPVWHRHIHHRQASTRMCLWTTKSWSLKGPKRTSIAFVASSCISTTWYSAPTTTTIDAHGSYPTAPSPSPCDLNRTLKKSWSTYKTVLGWDIDTHLGTIELPPYRKQRLITMLDEVGGRNRISQKHAHKLLGELRSMGLGILGSAGLFSLLQTALTTALRDRACVRLDVHTRNHIADLQILARSLSDRPTRIAELFPHGIPHGGGTTDASGSGLGGVLFPSPTIGNPPIVWRLQLPPELASELVSDANPKGRLNICDLELAATVIQDSMWATFDVAERTILNDADNSAAVVWRHKGSNGLRSSSAYLLREASLLQRTHRNVTRQIFINGTKNTLSDAASRRFEWDDHTLLTYLNAIAPQTSSWEMRPPLPETLSNVISALHRRRPARLSDAVWTRCWLPFLSDLHIDDPFLSSVDDKIPILRVFAQRLRSGQLSRSRLVIRYAHVRYEVFRVAKVFTKLGAPDPRLTTTGQRDPRLTAVFKGWSNEDPGPPRVKPMPLPILHHAARTVDPNDSFATAVIDMAWIAVFYLLRPGEYCKSQGNAPFTVGSSSLMQGSSTLDYMTCEAALLSQATHSSITFDDQKNCVRGEVIAHGRSGHLTACPTNKALARRLLHLRQHGATPSTPLCSVWHHNR